MTRYVTVFLCTKCWEFFGEKHDKECLCKIAKLIFILYKRKKVELTEFPQFQDSLGNFSFFTALEKTLEMASVLEKCGNGS